MSVENKKIGPWKSYALLLASAIVTIFVTYVIYRNNQMISIWALQQKVIAIAATAAASFSPRELDEIGGRDSIHSSAYRDAVLKLQLIRQSNLNLKYAYILRGTKNRNIFEFVADADSLRPNRPIDLNGDGIVSKSDALSFPGDSYNQSKYPEFVSAAFIRPYVDSKLSVDKWGTHLSATAPIFGLGAEARYVLGVDVDVSDFVRTTNLALVPFVLFAAFLLLILTTLTVSLVKMWGARVQTLAELDRQKDELLSIVSHQLAAPVTSIKWYLEMLLEEGAEPLSKDQRESMTSMQSISEDLSDLVSMILDVSRVQLGRMRVDPLPLDLNVFFREIMDVIDPKAKEKPVRLTATIPTDLPTVLLDKRLTRMTVENLLTNAVKYTPKDGQVTFLVERRAGDRLYVEVRDTGVGIPKADQAKIFGKQFRASNVRNAIDGNGFGLYVAKGAIESQDGKIWFESEEGKGTAFFIELPLVPPKEAQQKTPTAA